MNTITRPALGQRATVGTLYDARRDRFLPDSLLRDTSTPEAITSTAIDRRQTTSINSDSFKEKFAKLGLNNELIASFLAGMVNVQGSARYLTQKRDSLPTVHRALLYTLATRQENLNFTHPNLKDFLDFSALHTGNATHVVIGITWGARTVVAATHSLTPGTDRSKYELSLHESFRTFDESDGGSVPGLRRQWQETDDSPHVKVFSDVPDSNDDPPEDLESAFRHARSLSDRVEADKDGKSKPLTYALLPIGALVTLGAVILEDVTVGQLSSECLEKYINLVDDLSMAQQSLNAYYQSLKHNRFLVRPDHFTDVEDRLRTSKSAESDLASHYAQSLDAVRAGRSSSQKTWQILEDFLAADSAPGQLVEITNEYGEKLEFISMAVEQGAEFVGDSERSLHEALRKNARGSAKTYVFYFKNALMNKDASWEENADLLRDLLKEGQHKSLVLLVDCDVTGQQLQQCHISVFSKETVVTKDLLKERKLLADKHLLRYDSRYLEPITNLPSQRRTVKIPCPGPDCSPHDVYAWVCSKCHMSPEYGKADRFFYCDCGRFPSDRVEFNCQRPNHGPTFASYQRPVLGKLLKNLPPPKEVNILILGETGVGKSTFVNAFINYLTFSSLDEGLSANDLNWVIPCSFTTQLIDENDRLVSKNITIGSDGDERDGSKGQSATQMATVYPLYIGDILIRLIDTPGIGDTRGLDQDAKNMTNVLSVLRNYPDLHGILILLKPNNARLGVMFRFCVKELLTHLHRSAAENMVFGFTNTRGSNYAPGDTFKPLEKLLSDYRDVIPGLFRKNVYCFDSEGFRYLAARKQNIDMGNIDDYRRSWDHSTTEAERLLAHFRTLRPHHTQRTLSLNETRHLIAQLTAPMQQISTAITDSIANSEKHAKDLSDTRLTGQALRAKLQIQKVVVNATPLSRPKTVCANSNCVETVLNENDGQQVLLRKNLCHNPCCLTNVPVGKVGTPELVNCAAFNRETCRTCEHHWSEHEHIILEYSKSSQTYTDPQVQQELEQNGDTVKAKEAQIQALQRQIAELKNEHREIQEAAAKFSIYLKSNSITHYNDATIEYLEHLIRDERTKVGAGGSRAHLESLEKDLNRYKQFIKTMQEGNKTNPNCRVLDEAGVAQLVQKLYNLPHYGQMLSDLAQVVGRAYEATFRERPYRIRGKAYWMGDSHKGERGINGNTFLRNHRHPAEKKPVRSMLDFEDDTSERMGSPSFQDSSHWTSKLRKPFKPRDKATTEVNTSKQLPGDLTSWDEGFRSEKPSTAVKSISAWGDETTPYSGTPEESKPASAFSEAQNTSEDEVLHPSPSPPPYDQFSSASFAAEGERRGLSISQKKGVWVRIKDKLRKN